MIYTRHIVSEMADNMVQRCIICGKTISDYSNASWPKGSPKPKGFDAGEVYVGVGNPIIYTISCPDNELVIDCDRHNN